MFSAPNKAIKPISRAAIVEIDRSLGYEVGFITRGAVANRRVAILQTSTSSPIGFAKRAQIHVL